MRVLHLGKYYPPFAGGIEHFLADLLLEWVTQEMQAVALVHAHSWYPEGRAGTTTTADGIKITRVPTWGRLWYAPISPLFPWYLHKTLTSFKPDILHLHLPNTSAFWALWNPLARKLPWLVHWHADVVTSRLDRRLAIAYPLYRPLEQMILKQAHKILATSPPYLESSLSLAPWRDKCQVLPLGLNATRLTDASPVAQQAANAIWINDGLRLLTIGRLTYYKGHETLIKAVATVPNSQLIIVGKGERRYYLQRLIDDLDLAARVHLLGHLPGPIVQGLLASCDCLCLPSVERTEAFGLVLLEAMSCARPVISSAVSGSGMGWVVEDCKTGLLVVPGDVGAWVSAIRKLFDPQLRRKLGTAGKARLQQHFSMQSIAAKLTTIYNEML